MKYPPITEEVAKRIRRFRLEKNLQLSFVARQSEMPVSTYASIENGTCGIKIDRLHSILVALDADIVDVWPALAENRSLRAHRRRLRDLIWLSGADGGVVFRRQDTQVSVLIAEDLSIFSLDRLRFHLQRGDLYPSGIWFGQRRRASSTYLYLKAKHCPAPVERLVGLYLDRWFEFFVT